MIHRPPEPHREIKKNGAGTHKLAEANRVHFSNILKSTNLDLGVVTSMLNMLNPEDSEDYLKRILAIDPQASDSAKTEALLDLLGRHSPHTLSHVRLAGDVVGLLEAHGGMGPLRSTRLPALERAIQTHDMGKLAMRDSTLNVPHNQFTDQENKEKEGHPLFGHSLLNYLQFRDDLAPRIALTHHLRYQTVDGKPRLVGYPVADFLSYCERKGLPPVLEAEDHLAGFIDVYTALVDPERVANLHGTNDPKLSILERSRRAFEIMDRLYFKDDYYQKGEGAPLFAAFKEALTTQKTPNKLVA